MKLYERLLIDDLDNEVPKDYTIIFKYEGTIFQPILYIEIDVNVSMEKVYLVIYQKPIQQSNILERKHW